MSATCVRGLVIFVVASSLLVAVGYCPSSRVLVVQFRSGAMYGYFDVPFEVAQRMLGSESKGRFFNRSIRGAFRHVSLGWAAGGADELRAGWRSASSQAQQACTCGSGGSRCVVLMRGRAI